MDPVHRRNVINHAPTPAGISFYRTPIICSTKNDNCNITSNRSIDRFGVAYAMRVGYVWKSDKETPVGILSKCKNNFLFWWLFPIIIMTVFSKTAETNFKKRRFLAQEPPVLAPRTVGFRRKNRRF